MKASIILCSTLFLVLTILEAIHSLSTSVDLSLRELNEILGKDKREDDISDKDLLLSFNNYLSRQLMLQQLFVEERIRSDGGSGIKQIRLAAQGSKPYFVTSHTGSRVAAIHEHSNNIQVVGLGEFVAVLNGLEFRTRHNDYKKVKPHSTSSKYHETEDIVFPEVPPSVKAKTTVDEQIAEMKEYFRAWKEEDETIREYKDYFKPILCYLEGGWTLSASDDIQDPFESDRHKLAAKSWLDLQEKVRFTSYTGKKDPEENFAYLPTTILKQENDTLQLAQWNYRILCHPLTKHIDPSRLCLVDDLQARMAKDYTLDQYEASRSARFKVSLRDDAKCSPSRFKYSLLDELMEEVPGVNNYQGDLVDDSLGSTAQHYKTGETLNAAYYNRLFKTSKNDAMGSNSGYRGFADPEVFFAMTDQENIAPMSVKKCDSDGNNCVITTQRWTYAIPLEVIFTTPLHNWNPYNIEYKGWFSSDSGKTVTANGRNGEAGDDMAYDGNNNKLYYRTPADFFETDDVTGDLADTAKGVVHVLGEDNKAHRVRASGTHISLPPISGSGALRTRYPIMPIHFEQSAMWKEVAALKEVALNPKTLKHMYYEQFPEGTPKWVEPTPVTATATVVYGLGPSDEATNSHTHQVTLAPAQYLSIAAGTPLTVTTTSAEGHTHELTLINRNWGHFYYTQCDGSGAKCAGSHGRSLVPVPL